MTALAHGHLRKIARQQRDEFGVALDDEPFRLLGQLGEHRRGPQHVADALVVPDHQRLSGQRLALPFRAREAALDQPLEICLDAALRQLPAARQIAIGKTGEAERHRAFVAAGFDGKRPFQFLDRLGEAAEVIERLAAQQASVAALDAKGERPVGLGQRAGIVTDAPERIGKAQAVGRVGLRIEGRRAAGEQLQSFAAAVEQVQRVGKAEQCDPVAGRRRHGELQHPDGFLVLAGKDQRLAELDKNIQMIGQGIGCRAQGRVVGGQRLGQPSRLAKQPRLAMKQRWVDRGFRCLRDDGELCIGVAERVERIGEIDPVAGLVWREGDGALEQGDSALRIALLEKAQAEQAGRFGVAGVLLEELFVDRPGAGGLSLALQQQRLAHLVQGRLGGGRHARVRLKVGERGL